MMKIKNKKSQIYGQVFVYILMIVVFGSILVYGVYAVGQLINRAEKVEIEKFKMDMKTIVAENKEYGSIDAVEIKMPARYEELCFANSASQKVLTSDTVPKEIYSILEKIKSGANDNMFLYPPGTESVYVGPLDFNAFTQHGSKCFKRDSQGYAKFKLGGRGDRTAVCGFSDSCSPP